MPTEISPNVPMPITYTATTTVVFDAANASAVDIAAVSGEVAALQLQIAQVIAEAATITGRHVETDASLVIGASRSATIEHTEGS